MDISLNNVSLQITLHTLAESLAELKKTIATFSNFTSPQVNYEKSEIAGLGASK